MAIHAKSYPIWHPFTQEKTSSPPLTVKSGSGAVLTLEDGREILDCISSWWVTIHGHANPEIARAIYEQAQKLEQVIFAGFTHEPALQVADQVLRLLPPHFGKVFFSDNGSTAVEVAVKQAYQYWKNRGVADRSLFLCFEGAYHGDTIGAMSVGGRCIFNEVFDDLLFEAKFAPYPETWEGDGQVEEKEEKALETVSFYFQKQTPRIAAVLIEPLIQGAGGMRMCRPEFLRKLEKLAKEYGTLVIYDEVMTGFGRTGEIFSCVKAGTSPDIICLSKGLSGGFLPLSLTVSTQEVYEAFYHDDLIKAFLHGHSFTGSPLGCAAAVASMKLLERTPGAYREMEGRHRELFQILEGNPAIEKPRFCGTVFACDIKVDGGKGYTSEIGTILRARFLEKGFLLRPLGNTLYLLPPYCINDNQLEQTYRAIHAVLQEFSS